MSDAQQDPSSSADSCAVYQKRDPQRLGFFDLPVELREEIFSYTFFSTSTPQHRHYATERKLEIKLHLDVLARIVSQCGDLFRLCKLFRTDALDWLYGRVTILVDLSDVEQPRGKLEAWLQSFRQNDAMFLQRLEIISHIPESPSNVWPNYAPCNISISLNEMTATAIRPFDPLYWSVPRAENWALDEEFIEYRETALKGVDAQVERAMARVRTHRASGNLTGNHVKLIIDACFVASLEYDGRKKYQWLEAGPRNYLRSILDGKAQSLENGGDEPTKTLDGRRGRRLLCFRTLKP